MDQKRVRHFESKKDLPLQFAKNVTDVGGVGGTKRHEERLFQKWNLNSVAAGFYPPPHWRPLPAMVANGWRVKRGGNGGVNREQGAAIGESQSGGKGVKAKGGQGVGNGVAKWEQGLGGSSEKRREQ